MPLFPNVPAPKSGDIRENRKPPKTAFFMTELSVLNKTATEPYSEYQQDEDQKNDKTPVSETSSTTRATSCTCCSERHLFDPLYIPVIRSFGILCRSIVNRSSLVAAGVLLGASVCGVYDLGKNDTTEEASAEAETPAA